MELVKKYEGKVGMGVCSRMTRCPTSTSHTHIHIPTCGALFALNFTESCIKGVNRTKARV